MTKRAFPKIGKPFSASLWAALIIFYMSAIPRAAEAATRVVDDDGFASASDCDASQAAFSGIQSAVNAAAAGDTIQVCPGTYNEQVSVTRNYLTIVGTSTAETIVRPTNVAPNATNLFGKPVASVFLVKDVTGSTIRDLTIDGSLADSGANINAPCQTLPFYVGIFYRNSSGTLDSAHVTGFKSAASCAFGVRAETGDIVINGSLFDNYGISGIACSFTGTRCTLTYNTIRGQGPVADQSQAGIQVRSGSASKIAGNVISDHFLIGANGVPQSSVGIFLVYATATSNPHIVHDNIFVGNQVNVQRIASARAF